ncbi:MAG: ABC transporter permease [Terriglobia bacterium]
MRYLARRLVHGVLLLAGVSILSFSLIELAPGDFLGEMRLNPQVSPETIAALRVQYGLDQPLPVRYVRWVRSVLAGEFGFSFAYNSPVAPLLWVRARNTVLLTGTATVVAWLLAIPLGVWSATKQGQWGDRLVTAGTSVFLAVPDLLLSLVLLLFAVRTGALPTGGMVSVRFAELTFWGKLGDLSGHLLLPLLALVLSTLPVLVRHTRAGVVEVLASPFVQAARGHGLPRGRLLFRHVLPAAANPLISLFGFSVASLLSASLLIEVIMSWPGLGPLLLEAILARDLYVIIGAVMFSTVLLLLGNLLADLLLYVNDPRIRRE